MSHLSHGLVKGIMPPSQLMAEMRHGESATVALPEDTVLLELGLKLRLITRSSSH